MRYYHLSEDEHLKWIRPSSTSPETGTITPRIPRQGYKEDETTPRVCVSPLVWLCALAGVVLFGRLHIYMVDVLGLTDPLPGPDGNMSDFSNTGEKWITDKDIAACGGEIAMNYVGFIDVECTTAERIRSFVRCPVSPLAASDEQVWRIEGMRWLLRDAIA